MNLRCILDNCPADGQMVDHRKCCGCEYNPLGEGQPEFGLQECDHPDAVQDVHREAARRKLAEVLSVSLVRKR